MKANSRKSTRLRAALMAAVATVLAFFAYAATVDDIVPINSDSSWFASEANQSLNNGDFFDSDKHFLLQGGSLTFDDQNATLYEFTDGKKAYGATLGNKLIYFKLKDGFQATVKIYLRAGSSGQSIELHKNTKDGALLGKSTGNKGLEILSVDVSAENEDKSDATYVIFAGSSARFCGISIENVKEIPVEKPAASLAAITEDYQWRVSDGEVLSPGCNYIADAVANTYYTFYTGEFSLEATNSDGPLIDGKRVYGYKLADGTALGIKVGEGKGSLTFYIGSYWQIPKLYVGDYFPSATEINCKREQAGANDENNNWCGYDIITYEFSNDGPTVYWISQNSSVAIGGFDVKFDEAEKPFELEAPNLAAITDDFSWICTSDLHLTAGNNTPVNVDGAQKYYLYYNSADGTGAGETTEADTYLYGGGSMAYNLNDKRLGFKVGADDYVIEFYTSAAAEVNLYKGDDPATTVGDGIKTTRTVTVDGVSGKITRFLVRETEETTLWAEISGGAFAGFDVMANSSSADLVSSVSPLPTGSGSWTPSPTYLNYASGMGQLAVFKSGKGNEKYFYHLGQTVALQNEYYGCVPLEKPGYGLITAIGFRLDGARKSNIKVYTKGSGEYQVVKGADPLAEDVTVVATGNAPGTLDFTLSTTEETTLWVIGDKGVFVEKIEYEVNEELTGPLATIKGYHLWRAGETIDPDTYFDNNYLRYNTSDGTTALVPDNNYKTRVLGIETPTVVINDNNEILLKLGTNIEGQVKVYYIGGDGDLRMFSETIDDNTNKYNTDKSNEKVFWTDATAHTTTSLKCPFTTLEGTSVKTFGIPSRGFERWVHIVNGGNGTTARIAAIEVVIDKKIETMANKNIDWYVCGDAKMIAGSERVDGNTEYAEFYVSKGRLPRVSFFMPSILENFLYDRKDPAGRYKVTVTNGDSRPEELTFPQMYDGKTLKNIKETGDTWAWMTKDWEVSANKTTKTFKIVATDPVAADSEESRTWTVVLTFHFIDCPIISVSPDNLSSSANATLSMAPAKGYESMPIFYTIDSTDPANLDNSTVVTPTTEEYYSTKRYDGEVNVNVNCIALAGQYIRTEKPFYTDGPGSPTSSVFKLLSEEKYIMLADRSDITYVPDPEVKDFAKTEGEIEVLKVNNRPVMRFMYGKGNADNPVKFFRIIDNEDRFRLGGVVWGKGEGGGQDGGYNTYMDPYQFTLPATDPNGCNANPDTEMNGGIGGANTENGGMFLQPVAGSFFRLEPEYDGVATVWVRQNGMVDYANMFNGELSRRPVYVVDEDGVIQRGSTIKPTNLHHLSVNGVYATASGRNELRSSFANAWKYGTSFVEGWQKIHGSIKRSDAFFPMNYEILQKWFGDIVKLTTDGVDSYWYDFESKQHGGAPNTVTNSVNINRYSRIGTQLLYRDDWMYAQEEALRTTKYPNAINPFAKYGYEIPNFGYVQYRIPVKAGKSYYIGGRGTKNGFVAMQFEPMPPNYNNKDYQRIDNPDIIDGGTSARATLSWPGKEPDNIVVYSPEDAVKAYDIYENVPTLTIKENGGNQEWWTWYDANKRDDMLSGKTINVDLVREFEAGKWYPIVLPFSVSESRMREMFGKNVKVLYLDPYEKSYTGGGRSYNDVDKSPNYFSAYRPAIEGTELKFTYHCYQMLYANTPAFICPSEITSDSNLKSTNGEGKSVYHFRRVCFRGGEIKTYDIGGGYEVTGAYAPTSAGVNGEMYYISNENGKVVMYHSRNGIDMKGSRCWIRPKQGANRAPIMTMGFGSFSADGFDDDSGTTGITDVISDDAPATLYDNDNVYDIMGRIVATGSTSGLPSGVYIFKGKKVYVK